MAYTPTSGFLPSSSPDSELLPKTLAAEYRSLVGTAMYVAQERYDLQYTTKTLASCLQNPTKAAWTLLGRLVGYLRFSGEFGLKMNKTKKGSTFAEASLGVFEEKERNQLEVYSDSDWSGGGDMKSTRSAVHILNGIIVHSTVVHKSVFHFQVQKQSGMLLHRVFVMDIICTILLSLSQMDVVTL